MKKIVHNIIPFVGFLGLIGCSPSVPTEAELRLAAKSQLRKQGLPEGKQTAIAHGDITDLKCDGTDEKKTCSFLIGEKHFNKTFARTGSGSWSAYE